MSLYTCGRAHDDELQRCAGLRLLSRARAYAIDLGDDLWTHAIELGELLENGLSLAELRWLHRQKYIAAAKETTGLDSSSRNFESVRQLLRGERLSFVLCESGAQFVGRIVESNASPTVAPGAHEKLRPHWDSQLRRLTVSGTLVKHYKVPAGVQECILEAFEEEGWVRSIADPLPPVQDVEPKRRVQSAITSLNRNQRNCLLRFRGDGRGTGILWELVNPNP